MVDEEQLSSEEVMGTAESEVVVNDEVSRYDELLVRFQRLQAEFDNYRKRSERERVDYRISANAQLMKELLPVLDDFELSLKHHDDAGVRLMYDQLLKILFSHGLREVKSEGVFNPQVHEAILQVEGEEAGVIVEVLQKGYLLNEKLLRASKVKISKVKEV